MKQILLLSLFLMASLQNGAKEIAGNKQAIRIELQYIDPQSEVHKLPRIPAMPITVSQFGHIFTFPDYLAGEAVEIMSGETVAYTYIIGEDGTVTTSDDLTGEYTLVLHVGGKIYSAEVEL